MGKKRKIQRLRKKNKSRARGKGKKSRGWGKEENPEDGKKEINAEAGEKQPQHSCRSWAVCSEQCSDKYPCLGICVSLHLHIRNIYIPYLYPCL